MILLEERDAEEQDADRAGPVGVFGSARGAQLREQLVDALAERLELGRRQPHGAALHERRAAPLGVPLAQRQVAVEGVRLAGQHLGVHRRRRGALAAALLLRRRQVQQPGAVLPPALAAAWLVGGLLDEAMPSELAQVV